ncbi:MAG: AMP-binding protein [Burkholderiales bacterium]
MTTLLRQVALWSGTRPGRFAMERIQARALRRTVGHAARNSPFYRERFRELGIDPRCIRSAGDLGRLGFFTTPADFAGNEDRFLAVPPDRVVHACASSGTSGKPKFVRFSRWDWIRLVFGGAIGLGAVGVTRADVVLVMLAFGSPEWMTGIVTLEMFRVVGCLTIPASTTHSTGTLIGMMERFRPSVLVGIPSFIWKLTEEGSQITDLKRFGVRMIRLGGEPLGVGLRARLEEAWGAGVFDVYGMTECGYVVAGESEAGGGLHVNSRVVVEVVDPAGDRVLPDGDVGELVFTTLEQEATPFLRYRSGDLGSLCPGEGRFFGQTIRKVIGRKDDMVIVGSGVNLFPEGVERAMLQIPGVLGFQLLVEGESYRDRVTIRLETGPGAPPEAELSRRVRGALADAVPGLDHEIAGEGTLEEPRVEVVAPGSLAGGSGRKVPRVLDRRARTRDR